MRVWRRLILVALSLLVITAAGGVAWRARTEALRLITNPMETRRLPGRMPIDLGMIYDDVEIRTRDGLRLVGWYVPSRNGAAVIAQHGYKADRGEMLNEAAMLQRHGYGVLMPAMRAHDLSDGLQLTFGAHEIDDLEAWFSLLVTLPGVDAARIGILGNSLGGTLALGAAARNPNIRAVATNSAFSSLGDTIDTSVRFFTGMPPFPFAPLITFWAEREAGISVADVDGKTWIRQISPRPVLIMQGGADVVISTYSGQRLYDAAGEPKELWFDPDVGHSRFDTARPDEYERRVAAFFDKYL